MNGSDALWADGRPIDSDKANCACLASVFSYKLTDCTCDGYHGGGICQLEPEYIN